MLYRLTNWAQHKIEDCRACLSYCYQRCIYAGMLESGSAFALSDANVKGNDETIGNQEHWIYWGRSYGMANRIAPSGQFDQFVRDEVAKVSKVIRDGNIRIDS